MPMYVSSAFLNLGFEVDRKNCNRPKLVNTSCQRIKSHIAIDFYGHPNELKKCTCCIFQSPLQHRDGNRHYYNGALGHLLMLEQCKWALKFYLMVYLFADTNCSYSNISFDCNTKTPVSVSCVVFNSQNDNVTSKEMTISYVQGKAK